jgi:hypothetical protein
MKTLICFSLMAFLVFSGCKKFDNDSAAKPDENQLKAAPKNGSVSWNLSTGYGIPLVCDGEQVGSVFGWPVDWHIIDHYKNGELEWSIYNVTGSLKNSYTGENFKIQESDKLIWSQGDYTFHANLMGDQGTHYILSGHFDPATFAVFVDKAVCPNGPK